MLLSHVAFFFVPEPYWGQGPSRHVFVFPFLQHLPGVFSVFTLNCVGVGTDQRCHKYLIVEPALQLVWLCAVGVIPFTLSWLSSSWFSGGFFLGITHHICVLPRLAVVQLTQESDLTRRTCVAVSAKSLLKRFNFNVLNKRPERQTLEKCASPK